MRLILRQHNNHSLKITKPYREFFSAFYPQLIHIGVNHQMQQRSYWHRVPVKQQHQGNTLTVYLWYHVGKKHPARVESKNKSGFL
jgi:hypothetical protein